MKETFKKVFNRAVLEPIVIFVASMLTLEFLVYPGLTTDNTFLNLLSGAIGIILVLVVLSYADDKIRILFEKKNKEVKDSESETEKPNEDGVL
jgi:hypothetical protein